MPNTITNNGYGTRELADKVRALYSEGVDGLSAEDCKDLNIGPTLCSSLQSALGLGIKGIIEPVDMVNLRTAGFSDEFIGYLAGPDGGYSIYNRAAWLQDRVSPKWWQWWRPSLTSDDRSKMIDELAELAGMQKTMICDMNITLAELLTDDNEEIRNRAVHALSKGGHCAITYLNIMKDKEKKGITGYIVQILTNMLDSDEDSVRDHAARSLSRCGPLTKIVVKKIAERAENDVNDDVRIGMLQSIGNMGSDAIEASVTLIRIMENDNENPDVQAAAIDALFDIAYNSSEIMEQAIPETIKRWTSSDHNLRRAVHRNIEAYIYQYGTIMVPYLILALQNSDSLIREDIIRYLGKIGQEAFMALPDLEEMKDNDPDPECRKWAGWAYDRILEKTW